MKIALIGYGKMGKAIERIAVERGHEIVLKISSSNLNELTKENLATADVAIEFTKPEAAKENVLSILSAGTPVVCGTTGWNDQLPEAYKAANDNHTAVLQTSNFSVGVNIFFELNRKLAAMMNDYPEYNLSMEETHHTQKKDAPSGTAITLAELAIENLNRKKQWSLGATEDAETFPITAYREENVPGTHKVLYSSAIDDIEIIHTAHNRDGFAKGAVIAAEFIAGKQGVFTMKDVLGI